MAPPNPAVLQIFLFRDGEFLGTDMFSERQVVVGRDPTVADLVLESSQVSRKHAILEQDGSTVSIRDAGSTNGIYLNNERIDRTELTRLDEVLLGDFSIKVKLVSKGKPALAAKPPPTRVASPTEFDADARMPPEDVTSRLEQADSDRPTRADASTFDEKAPPRPARRPPARKPGSPRADLSDWDDVLSVEMNEEELPHAEFRDGEEVMDQNRLGEVLENIGISAKHEARPKPKKPSKRGAKPSGRSSDPPKKGRRADPLPSFEDSDSGETAIGEAPRMLDEDSGFDDSGLRGSGPAFPSDEQLGSGPVEWVDDDDDEDANYVPPYSLVAQLLQEDAIVGRDPSAKPLVEVLTLQGDTVADANLLRPGDSFWVGPEIGFLRRRRARDLPPRVRLLKYRRGGQCQVEMHQQVTGTLKRGQQRIKLDAVSGVEKNRRRGTMMMGFKTGEILDIVDGGSRYHIRFVSAPPPIRDGRGFFERLRPDKWLMRSFGGSVGAHLFGLILVYLLVPPEIVHSTLRKNDEFVEVVMDAAPEIEEEKPKEEEPEPEEPEQAQDEKAPPKQNKSKRRARSGGTSKAPAGVLGLLSKKGSSKAPGPAAAVAAVSNLTAAKVPGASAGYRVSGLIGKLPSNSLSVGGGGGGLMTKGGAALLRGGGGGGGLARGKSRGVGGLVQKNPKAMRSVGQGHLDRDEIQKVINKHISQIQRCYERELLKTPGLSGKVQVEWTIATSGRVRSARQTYTSIKSTSVSNCILGAIRGWVFPKPRGGEVIVNYPFIFKSIGF